MQRRRLRLLPSLYTMLSLLAYLLAYPLTGVAVLDFASALIVSWAAAYTAYTVPRYSSLLFLAALYMATVSILAGSLHPALNIIASNTLILTLFISLYTLASILVASIRRIIGVLAAATGALAATLLRLPYGHLLAAAALAAYTALSPSPSRSVLAVTYYMLTWMSLSLRAAAEGHNIGFVDFSSLDVRPQRPLVEAFARIETRVPPHVASILDAFSKYLGLSVVTTLAIYMLLALLAKQVEASTRIHFSELRAKPYTVLLATSALAALAYIIYIDVNYSAAAALGLEAHAPLYQTLGIMCMTALITGMWHLAAMCIQAPVTREERSAIREALAQAKSSLEVLLRECSPGLSQRLREEMAKIMHEIEVVERLAASQSLVALGHVARMYRELSEKYSRLMLDAKRELQVFARGVYNALKLLIEWCEKRGYPLTSDVSKVLEEPMETMDAMSACHRANKLYNALRAALQDVLEYVSEEVGRERITHELLGIREQVLKEPSRETIELFLKQLERVFEQG